METWQIQNNSQYPSVPSNVTQYPHQHTVGPPSHSYYGVFPPNSSISLHPPSSHCPQVACSVLSSTAWINDWCSRPQVKVRKVHYWIISALLSLLPSAWLLLVDVVEALEGTLFAKALKTWTRVCFVCILHMYVWMFSSNEKNTTCIRTIGNIRVCTSPHTHLHLRALRSLLVPI